ncbi:ATP-dependent helicase [Hahella aquimaris]|uniref:ATP-dependent helicase n=1 Tax=Hahella sp. HNIBRBA332 TaxID=3015983 RepID=UPI00273BD857|nr:ATP-dependent helicase [Hahella sp. HNIBRBA332]WLQ12577.1 ATP-dependent helicase [Hahella sp. HNIBRBA332]
MQLTEEQQRIIQSGFEHSVITAVAGSGKTTTLAHRIHHLMDQGHDPRRILILMFNRAAKEDFERKLREVAGAHYRELPEVRTYHAMGLRLYQRFIREGALPAFVGQVLSDQEIHFQLWQLLRRHAPESHQDSVKRNKKEYIELASRLLDMSKTSLLPLQTVFEQLEYRKELAFLLDVVNGFEAWRKSHARISFADMLYEPVKCLQESPDLVKLVADKMDVILVDEYQDTNEIQHLLLRYIAGKRARVTVVGDPDQTIYEFRGAQPEFILNRFAEEFESPREFTLSYTFRYGHKVALLANHLITHNHGRKDVLCRSHMGTPATEVNVLQGGDETRQLVLQLGRLLNGGCEPEEIAILFRVWSQAVPIELALLAHRIPYRIDGDKGALANREVMHIQYVLEMASGRLSMLEESKRAEVLAGLLRFPHVGLKDDTLRELAHTLAQHDAHWGDQLVEWIPDSLHALQKRKLKRTAQAWSLLPKMKGSAADIVRFYIDDTELFKSLEELALTHETADERINNVLGIEHYLATLNLPSLETLQHFDELRRLAGAQKQQGGVTLSTMHRTKGLEWPVVMIIGLNEQYLPYSMRGGEDIVGHLQAERRLLYVAMTRAKKAIYLFTPTLDGKAALSKDDKPSRFVKEASIDVSTTVGAFLDQCKHSNTNGSAHYESTQRLTPIATRYLEWHDVNYEQPAQTTAREPEQIWSGDRVRHSILGEGEVIADLDDAFQVEFEDGRRMNFSKKSAHLYFNSLGG